LQRRNGCGAFTQIAESSPGKYESENRHVCNDIATCISDAERCGQRIRMACSPIISMQGDGGKDLGKSHNMTLDVRYIDVKTNRTITEFFFIARCGATAEEITRLFIHALGPDLVPRVVGGAFDSASNMHGDHGGTKALLTEYLPHSHWVRCVSHRSQLAGKKASRDHPEIEEFIGTVLPGVSAVYTNSQPRVDQLHLHEEEFGETHASGAVIIPKPLATTRWKSAHEVSEALKSIAKSITTHVRTRHPTLAASVTSDWRSTDPGAREHGPRPRDR
jgi:hypothetical protein